MIASCRLRTISLAIGLICLVTVRASAEAPWKNILTFHRVEAEAGKAYLLAEQDGPWMIMAATFAGEGAQSQAEELVHELRKRYKLRAFTHDMRFDYTQRIEGRGLAPDGSPMRMKHLREVDVNEIAVLVGNFESADDPAMQKALARLKYAQPEALKLEEGRVTYQQLAGFRSRDIALVEDGGAKILRVRKSPGPMGHAFVTRNPLLPADYFAPKGVDKLVLDMNKNVEHGLLDCPGRYTVQVATFSGNLVIEQDVIKAIEREEAEMPSKLEEAALKAHKLTVALRAKGYEAYEFHDRCLSIVTVGSFDSVGTPRQDGRIEINPQIHAIMQTFGAEKKLQGGQSASVGAPKSLGGIFFDAQPMPVEVPQRSISSDYAGR